MSKNLSNIVQTSSSITKYVVGLDQVDNTSDIAKPVSQATQTALNGKQQVLVSGTNIRTIGGASIIGSGSVTIAGDATATGTGTTLNISLSPTGVAAGTYNTVTVDTKGRVTSATNTPNVTYGRSLTMSLIFGY
jgi:phage-related tail fiber protein